MDLGKLADRLDLDIQEYLELLELFFKTGAADLKRLRTAAEEGNVEETIHASHSLKGASGNLGIMALHVKAKQIEEDARNGQMDGMEKAVQSLNMEFNELIRSAAQA